MKVSEHCLFLHIELLYIISFEFSVYDYNINIYNIYVYLAMRFQEHQIPLHTCPWNVQIRYVIIISFMSRTRSQSKTWHHMCFEGLQEELWWHGRSNLSSRVAVNSKQDSACGRFASCSCEAVSLIETIIEDSQKLEACFKFSNLLC